MERLPVQNLNKSLITSQFLMLNWYRPERLIYEQEEYKKRNFKSINLNLRAG
jgi:hypothetical protein